jgi:hypothetical protein
MKRLVSYVALMLLTACGGGFQSCSYPDDTGYGGYYPPNPILSVVPTTGSGPGRITYVNSDPPPGTGVYGCGAVVGGCLERLKVVFNLRPDVDLRSQRLRVRLVAETGEALDCASTGFDLSAGETFAIQVSCPSSPGGPATPFTALTMTVETGPSSQRIEQAWRVPYTFRP